MSHVIDELLLKMSQGKVKEVHIHGLNVVHIDVDLSIDKWHGINIVVVTDKIFVHKKITWDVSGMRGETKWNSPAADGLEPGGDAKPGDHGSPGESGGNIHIICNEAVNALNWTLISQGGTGGPGQNGGNGMDGGTGADGEKLTQTQFQEKFPSMSYLDDYKWYDGFCKIQNTLKDLKVTLNTNWSSDPKAVINYLEPFGIRNVQLDDIVTPITGATALDILTRSTNVVRIVSGLGAVGVAGTSPRRGHSIVCDDIGTPTVTGAVGTTIGTVCGGIGTAGGTVGTTNCVLQIPKPETRPTPVSLFIEGKTNETDRHIIVFFSRTNFKWSGRHSLYYYQGANGSPGLIVSFHLRRFFLL